MARTMTRLARCIAVGLLVSAVSPSPARAFTFEPSAYLQLDHNIDGHRLDLRPSLATDGNGNWIAVWQQQYWFACEGYRIRVSRSTDDGRAWSHPTSLADQAPDHFTRLRYPQVATDRDGVWIAVWEFDASQLQITRSLDAGLTWEEPQTIDVDILEFRLATDGDGTWIIVGSQERGEYPEFDFDLVIMRSVDHGLTWSAPEPLNADHETDFRKDDWLGSATHDGYGSWIVAWSKGYNETPTGQILASNSFVMTSEDGVSWSDPVLISDDELSVGWDTGPSVRSAGSDTLVAVWRSVPSPLQHVVDGEVATARSLDGGATWSDPSFIDPNAVSDDADNQDPQVRTDGRGNWVALWVSQDATGPLGYDRDLIYAHSVDDGLTWTAPQPFNEWAATDGASVATGQIHDRKPAWMSDGRGNWVVTWSSDAVLGSPEHPDPDIVKRTYRIPFVETCASDLDGDGFGSPGDAGCPLGAVSDCDDANADVAPGAPQYCDGVNNDCTSPGWPSTVGTSEWDNDGDGLSACDGDCNDADGSSSSIPGPVGSLIVSRPDAVTAELQWTPPADPGGSLEGLRFDVLRSLAPGNFKCDAVCLATDSPELSATDPDSPAPGSAFFYLVRPENGCPDGSGPLGGEELLRVGRDCS